ncbi:hypothetical protein ElyMa_004128700 [Elysia marginata]|uniref:CTNNB1 binding N-teminal domain-containing protein n=1 Tax=Elysia marginata TaxID=1093978 RepID=A0AAV4GDQ6_9GAST|nr:hypothetical protein ElyMa_004128700 [Elysia marginata]
MKIIKGKEGEEEKEEEEEGGGGGGGGGGEEEDEEEEEEEEKEEEEEEDTSCELYENREKRGRDEAGRSTHAPTSGANQSASQIDFLGQTNRNENTPSAGPTSAGKTRTKLTAHHGDR